ncbi:gluconate 2-dehydrogenase subunit 3 family protein [Deminuibacter soli]|uniref:Gluconate 2-dehydrogenase subunit 3 family protein n=1 Tax=Deminuibacter soli TaxID=2291815 RepID=A0A3E1NR84_9BACT|nr:gluconate 2-dehydrogenase subunit 3 family protein [Deminuibacter soli]RFM30410.1 gluconate 2-dehydrogenase subunit 3 family protein [Deminuibacter soli]
MNRRDALSRVGLLMGATVIGSEFFLSGCKNTDKKGGSELSKDDIAFLDEVGETIIPTTSTPGAKSVGIGAFMNMMVKDCYTDENQKIFTEGIGKLDEASKKKNSKSFLDSTPEQRTALLNDLDAEQKAYYKSKKKEDPEHYFKLMKQLTLLGYFTSETGATKTLRYIETPGHYDGNLPYKKGDKAWATS